MKKYVSPIIEIEEVEVEDIMELSNTTAITPGENETPGISVGGGEEAPIPDIFSQYFNEQ